MQKRNILLITVLALLLAACQAAPPPTATPSSAPSHPWPPSTAGLQGPVTFPKIDRHPAAADWHRGTLTTVADLRPQLRRNRGKWTSGPYDLSGLDFSKSLDDLCVRIIRRQDGLAGGGEDAGGI